MVQRAYTGALATEAVCCQLSAEGALLVGTRRLRVAAVASSRPQLRLRCEAALQTPRRSSPRATWRNFFLPSRARRRIVFKPGRR